MDLYAPLCRNVVMPLWAKWEKTPYLKHLKYLDKSQYFSEEQLRTYQLERLQSQISHAYQNTPFYKTRFKKAHINPDDIKSFKDFRDLPLLSKDEVRKHIDDILDPNVDRYYKFITSGSTGKPLTGYWDKECSQWKRACALRSSLWSGCRLGERIYQLYGSPEKEMRGIQKMRSLFRRKVLHRTEILDLLNVSPSSMDRFIKKMRARPPAILFGHTHALYLLATYMFKNGVDDIRPKGMFNAGMPMHQFERQRIEDVFHCPIQNRYGCEELGMIACECRSFEGLHVNTDSLYVECLNADGHPVPNGNQGQIVITDLTNRAMPLIRYKLEDWIIMSERRCSCGRTQPMIEKIEGRTADFLITPEGKLVSGISLTDHFAGHIPGVDQIQIIQNVVDRITLKLVKNDIFDEQSHNRISRLVEDFFGSAMAYDLEFVKCIEKDPSGKYRFAICNVRHELTQ